MKTFKDIAKILLAGFAAITALAVFLLFLPT